MVAAGVIFFGGNDAAFRACRNAQVALLAKIFIYLNITFQN
jgi:hypothetical protein